MLQPLFIGGLLEPGVSCACTMEDKVMSEAINAALAILAASFILWAVEPARAEVQDGGKKTATMEPARLSEPGGCAGNRSHNPHGD